MARTQWSWELTFRVGRGSDAENVSIKGATFDAPEDATPQSVGASVEADIRRQDPELRNAKLVRHQVNKV